MKKNFKTITVLLLTMAVVMTVSGILLMSPQSGNVVAAPGLPTAESPAYTGPRIEYAEKDLWFNSYIYHGGYNAYLIVKGNGDSTFNIDAFINSKQGELVLSRVRLELCILGQEKWGSSAMIKYWAERGVQQTVYDSVVFSNKFVTYVPDYMDQTNKKYPLVIDVHGGGGTLFESMNHGFVDICYDQGFIVATPAANSSFIPLYMQNLDKFIDEVEAAGSPIDRSRVYLVGMSMGGMASMSAGMANTDLVAAIAPHSSARQLDITYSGDLALTDEMFAASKKLPMYLEIGSSDFNQLPLSANLIAGLNKWVKMNNADAAPALAASDNAIGITADSVYTRTIDETLYTFADFKDKKGNTMVRIVGVDGLPHWVSYSYSELAWDFMKQFSRDTNGNLKINASVASTDKSK